MDCVMIEGALQDGSQARADCPFTDIELQDRRFLLLKRRDRGQHCIFDGLLIHASLLYGSRGST
jgi:hypothetical protein